MGKKSGFEKSLLLAVAVFALFFAACPEEPENNGGGHDIDSSLYGTWKDSTGGNILTITFSADGIEWGGSTGTALSNIQGATWTAKNGKIEYKWSSGTTIAYTYTINNSGNLLLTDGATGLVTITLFKDGSSGAGASGISINDAIHLTANQWASGNISTSGGQQWFTFTATASTQYIHAGFDALNDLYVQVYNSNGDTVGSQANLNSSNRYTSQSLTSGQTYYIKVWPYSGSGNYQIAFNTSSTPPSASGGGGTWTPGYSTTTLTANQWANGISTSGWQQWFVFTATSSTQYIHITFGTLTDL